MQTDDTEKGRLRLSSKVLLLISLFSLTFTCQRLVKVYRRHVTLVHVLYGIFMVFSWNLD